MLKVAEQVDKEENENNQDGEGQEGEEGELEREDEGENEENKSQEAIQDAKDAYSSVSRPGGVSQVSASKSVVSSLQHQLDEERFARIKLEKDLASLQRI